MASGDWHNSASAFSAAAPPLARALSTPSTLSPLFGRIREKRNSVKNRAIVAELQPPKAK
jgi:hypothetical protein